MKSFILATLGAVLIAGSANAGPAFDAERLVVDTIKVVTSSPASEIDAAFARVLPSFVSAAAWSSYISDKKSTGDYDLAREKGLSTKTILGTPVVGSEGDGKWSVIVPADTNYAGSLNFRRCTAFTVNVVTTEAGLKLGSVSNAPSECEDNRDI